MKRRTQIACFSAAIAALSLGSNFQASADILQWDASGNSAPTYTDGGGIWDTNPSDTFWVDNLTSTNVPWTNATPPNSAVFGNPSPTATFSTSAPGYEIDLANDITVQDITLGTAANGGVYGSITDAFGGSLTINGNITKATSGGPPSNTANVPDAVKFFMLVNNITLTAGDHTIAANDTSGSAHPELEFDADLAGPGNIIINNGSYAQWGVTAFTQGNDYTGNTTVTKGELVITDGNALGSTSAGTTIASQGALSIGGNGTTLLGGLNINEPITITRNTYTGTDYSDYPDALISANTGQPGNVNTLNGPIIIDSTDARISANTSTIVIPNSLIAGPDVAAGTAVADFDGDFAGFVTLSGDNTSFGGAIRIMGGVELNVSSEANLGGPNSTLILAGGTIHPTGALATGAFMTNFGAHNLSSTAINTGVDIDAGNTFTVNGLNGIAIGERGNGTMNFNGTNVFTGIPFFDNGTININGSTTFGAFRLRSPIAFNINSGAILTTTNSFTDIGSDSPDNATLNVLGTGKLVLANQDFNISDNAGTTGVLKAQDNAIITAAGATYIGKAAGSTGTLSLSGSASFTEGTPAAFNPLRVGFNNATAKGFITVADSATLTVNGQFDIGITNSATGTVTQSGGTINANKTGGNSFDLGDGNNSTGSFIKSGGATTVLGETWIGSNSGTSVGNFTMTGGTYNASDWFVVGRNGSLGTLDISGGTITRGGTAVNDHNYVGESAQQGSTMTVHGTGSVIFNTGQFWLGNAGSSKGTLNIADSGSVQVTNNWLAVGRNGTASGVINISGGTLTKTGTYTPGTTAGNGTGTSFTIGSGGTATGTVNQTGGTINSAATFVGENGTGTFNISAGTANLNTYLSIGTSGSGKGTLNISATGRVVAGPITFGAFDTSGGTLNLNGGTLTASSIGAGLSTGTKTFNFNGGTLTPVGPNAKFLQGLTTANVQNGGAIINTNGQNITIAQALVHDTTSGAPATDGGLTKQGTGTLTLSGAETYTGATTDSAGTLQYIGNNNQTLSSLSIANGATLDLSGGGTVAVTAGLPGYLADIQAGYANGAWNGASASAPVITSSYASTHFGTGVGYSTSGGGLTLRLTYLGDTDLNGVVNTADFAAMTEMASGGTWATGDFNYDGAVNADDFSLAQLGAAISGGGNITAVVPEPAMAILALPLLAGLMPRRSRRR